MTLLERFYPEARIGRYSDIDGTVAFFTRVNALLRPDATVLDVGCGRGEYKEDPVAIRRNLRILRGKVARVVGIDVDPAGQHNPFVDEFRLIQGDQWPVETASVDLIVCDNVIEHLEHPDRFFAETRRVLVDGGYLCVRTTNRLGYVALFSSLIPNHLHARVLGRVQKGRKEEDVFPTVYRCNTTGKIRKMMARYGFEGVAYGYEAELGYLGFSWLTYGLGVLYQRLAPRVLRHAIFAFARVKKAGAR